MVDSTSGADPGRCGHHRRGVRVRRRWVRQPRTGRGGSIDFIIQPFAEQVAADQDDEPSGDQPTATSIDDIDPDVCNWIHNITACDGDPEDPYPMPVGPFPMPVLEGSGALDLTSDEEIQCGPDEAVSIAPDGQVSCLTVYQTEDDKDTSDRLEMPTTIKPTPVD